jgi:hypothetical protein
MEIVFKNNPPKLYEPKQNTELCISNVIAETLHRAATDTKIAVIACIVEHSEHFQHVIKGVPRKTGPTH